MLKVGLIGCGFMGSMHANCYNVIDGVQVTAVADLRPEKSGPIAAISGAEIYTEAKDLIDNADVDIIDICLPTYLHTKYALMAMDKVKYLFIEKPVALTAEEGDQLLEKAAATGCKVQVGQVIRFWDEYVKLREYIEEGTFGAVVNASFKRISPRPGWGWNNWLLDAALSGGAGQDLHVHDTDYVLSVFGEPEKFYSVKNTISETNSYVSTLMKYPGFVVTTEGTWDLPECYPFQASFRVVFEKAVAEYAGGVLKLYDAEGEHVVEIEKVQLESSNSGGNISDLGGYYNELLAFVNSAATGGEIRNAILPDAVQSLKFILKELTF